MGRVTTKVRMTNFEDKTLFKKGFLKENQIRSIDVEALVDTGATNLVITQDIVDKLGLEIIGQIYPEIATGERVKASKVRGIILEVIDVNREDEFSATVLGNEVLIGQIVLESLDLVPDCIKQKLIPRYEEGIVYTIK